MGSSSELNEKSIYNDGTRGNGAANTTYGSNLNEEDFGFEYISNTKNRSPLRPQMPSRRSSEDSQFGLIGLSKNILQNEENEGGNDEGLANPSKKFSLSSLKVDTMLANNHYKNNDHYTPPSSQSDVINSNANSPTLRQMDVLYEEDFSSHTNDSEEKDMDQTGIDTYNVRSGGGLPKSTTTYTKKNSTRYDNVGLKIDGSKLPQKQGILTPLNAASNTKRKPPIPPIPRSRRANYNSKANVFSDNNKDVIVFDTLSSTRQRDSTKKQKGNNTNSAGGLSSGNNKNSNSTNSSNRNSDDNSMLLDLSSIGSSSLSSIDGSGSSNDDSSL
ncbi:hypothetical protein PACTADRAFT_185062 [Pachysolen tannophilus NRRL Y-2460]|uniref:Uncharacterized protein n=1 Tax=Pachysolen tannophilus NRRL Y-2460 TaxID=669874 RepID=A0A1E4U334_PACTA|nr:hypothetical protein PACTADRAFT_185062 [Pachysolen tannophilus NRRL Y-2460]